VSPRVLAASPRAFTASGAFERLGVNAQERFPGADGLSGSFDATEAAGSLKLASRAMPPPLPRVLAEPLPLDSATGTVRWERDGDTLSVRVSDFAFANTHGAGAAAGTWHSLAAGPGGTDLPAHHRGVASER